MTLAEPECFLDAPTREHGEGGLAGLSDRLTIKSAVEVEEPHDAEGEKGRGA
jgi:hypothetical protein